MHACTHAREPVSGRVWQQMGLNRRLVEIIVGRVTVISEGQLSPKKEGGPGDFPAASPPARNGAKKPRSGPC
eukprot:14109883-Alexandrium_andersonii.AAC.1